MGRKILNFIKGIFFVFTAILIGLVIFAFVIKEREETTLKEELITFQNKDLGVDNFNISIKTKGDYAYVEEAIKKYYKSLSSNVKDINFYLNNNDFLNILATEELIKNRPDYTYSHITVKSTRSKINKAIGEIDKLCSEDTIKDLINKDELMPIGRSYYYDLFLKYIYTEDDIVRLDNLKEEMDLVSKQLNSFLDKIDEILVFLHKNDEEVILDEEKGINFSDKDTLNEFKKLYNELLEIAGNFMSGTDDEKAL